ncbi:DUF4817 domain-containing protein [Trichonephila clavipes]|nr:DUF4817 domain-containing protein [Trichonephila clavipes]
MYIVPFKRRVLRGHTTPNRRRRQSGTSFEQKSFGSLYTWPMRCGYRKRVGDTKLPRVKLAYVELELEYTTTQRWPQAHDHDHSASYLHYAANVGEFRPSRRFLLFNNNSIAFEDGDRFNSCKLIYSHFGLAIHQNDPQARRRFVEWAQNEIAVVTDFHKRILLSDEAHFWSNGYVDKQNCRIWSEANPQVYVETPLHPEKLTVWCALWTGGILQKR